MLAQIIHLVLFINSLEMFIFSLWGLTPEYFDPGVFLTWHSDFVSPDVYQLLILAYSQKYRPSKSQTIPQLPLGNSSIKPSLKNSPFAFALNMALLNFSANWKISLSVIVLDSLILLHISASHKTVAYCSPRRGVLLMGSDPNVFPNIL